MAIKNLQPESWKKPKGYSNGFKCTGSEWIVLSGQIGWNENGEFETEDFVGQVRQSLINIEKMLAQSDAGPEHVVRMTWYITDKHAYLSSAKALGKVYRDIMGNHFPPMSVVQVVALMEDEAKVEIEVTALK